MKHFIIAIVILISLRGAAQTDSNLVKISVVITFKEVNYMGSFIYDNDPVYGDLADSVKTKYRGQADPSEANSVTITGTIGAWIAVDNKLRADAIAVSNNQFKKVDDALKLLTTQTFLIRQLAIYDAANTVQFQEIKSYGKFRNRRQ